MLTKSTPKTHHLSSFLRYIKKPARTKLSDIKKKTVNFTLSMASSFKKRGKAFKKLNDKKKDCPRKFTIKKSQASKHLDDKKRGQDE